jgi:ADP-ribose pyrophosphatase YjhB (NUDIX family)
VKIVRCGADIATIVAGERIGKQGRLAVGCSASVFDAAGEKMLLTRRSDNGQWCVPGGYMEPGESVTEACLREVLEETGLQVEVKRLIGVYTTPHRLLTYPDGNRWQIVVLHFEATPIGGELRTGDETTELRYFTPAEMKHLSMNELDRQRVAAGFAQRATAVICDDFTVSD